MKNNIREMIKSAIQENAVSFKETASNELYIKVATKLQEQYKTTAKKFFSIQEENKKIKISNLDRVEGHEDNQSGIGARYVGTGSDGKKYSFWHSGDTESPKGQRGLMHLPEIDIDDPRIQSIEVLDQE